MWSLFSEFLIWNNSKTLGELPPNDSTHFFWSYKQCWQLQRVTTKQKKLFQSSHQMILTFSENCYQITDFFEDYLYQKIWTLQQSYYQTIELIFFRIHSWWDFREGPSNKYWTLSTELISNNSETSSVPLPDNTYLFQNLQHSIYTGIIRELLTGLLLTGWTCWTASQM